MENKNKNKNAITKHHAHANCAIKNSARIPQNEIYFQVGDTVQIKRDWVEYEEARKHPAKVVGHASNNGMGYTGHENDGYIDNILELCDGTRTRFANWELDLVKRGDK